MKLLIGVCVRVSVRVCACVCVRCEFDKHISARDIDQRLSPSQAPPPPPPREGRT